MNDRTRARLATKKATLAEQRQFEDWQRGGGKRLREAELQEFFTGFPGANDPGIDPEDPTGVIFHRHGQRYRRGVPHSLQDEQSRQISQAVIENPFLNRIANLTGDFIVGSGIKPKSDVPELKDFIDQMWEDKINNFKNDQHKYAKEYPMMGEVVWERVLNHETGQIRINPRDPLEIVHVLGHAKFDLTPARIVFQQPHGQKVTAHILNTLPADLQTPVSDDVPMVYFYRANAMTGSLRGLSQYYSGIEWADLLDSSSFTLLERMVVLMTYAWHLEMENYDKGEAKKYKALLQNAGPNTALVTGPGFKLTAIAPDLKAGETISGAQYAREILAMQAGVPVNWLAAPGQANVGEAASMDAPTLKSLSRLQREFIGVVLKQTFDDGVTQAYLRGRFNGVRIDGKDATLKMLLDAYEFDHAPVSKKELGQVVIALSGAVNAMSIALSEGFFEQTEAARLVRSIAGEIIQLPNDLPEMMKKMQDLGVGNDDLKAFNDINAKTAAALKKINPNGSGGAGSKIDVLSVQSA